MAKPALALLTLLVLASPLPLATAGTCASVSGVGGCAGRADSTQPVQCSAAGCAWGAGDGARADGNVQGGPFMLAIYHADATTTGRCTSASQDRSDATCVWSDHVGGETAGVHGGAGLRWTQRPDGTSSCVAFADSPSGSPSNLASTDGFPESDVVCGRAGEAATLGLLDLGSGMGVLDAASGML
jgi:hypothetical protein